MQRDKKAILSDALLFLSQFPLEKRDSLRASSPIWASEARTRERAAISRGSPLLVPSRRACSQAKNEISFSPF